MYCSKCGSQIPEGSRFCSFCGAPVAEVQIASQEPEPPAVEPQAPSEPEPEPVRRHFIEDIDWNVNEYPNTETIEKTDDIDFDWGADPAEIRERLTREYPEAMRAEIREKADALSVEDIIPSKPAQPEYPKPSVDAEEISASDKIDKFVTNRCLGLPICICFEASVSILISKAGPRVNQLVSSWQHICE